MFPKVTGGAPSAWLRWAADPPATGELNPDKHASNWEQENKPLFDMHCIWGYVYRVVYFNVLFIYLFSGVSQTSCSFWLWAGRQELHPTSFWRHGRLLQVWLFQHASSCEYASRVHYDFHFTLQLYFICLTNWRTISCSQFTGFVLIHHLQVTLLHFGNLICMHTHSLSQSVKASHVHIIYRHNDEKRSVVQSSRHD